MKQGARARGWADGRMGGWADGRMGGWADGDGWAGIIEDGCDRRCDSSSMFLSSVELFRLKSLPRGRRVEKADCHVGWRGHGCEAGGPG